MQQQQPQASTSMPAAQGTAEVDRLLLELERNLDYAKFSLQRASSPHTSADGSSADDRLQEQQSLLSHLKVLGRDPSTARPIFTKRGISVISRHGLDNGNGNVDTSQEALRCLANALLLNEPSRQIFVDLGYAPRAVDRLKVNNRDDEFLISRILFLLTYNTKVDFERLFEDKDLADSINQNVSRHSKNFTKSGRRKSATSPMIDMALTETLKLMFNITYYNPEQIWRFTPAIEPLINLIMYFPLLKPPLQPPMTYLLNALLNLDLQAAEEITPLGREARSSPLFPYSNPEGVIDRLTSILLSAIRNHPESDLDQAGAPLVTLIRRLYELADPKMKSWMRWVLLPRLQDRDKPLGQGDTLASRLLRLSCSPFLPSLRENISSLLFELSDSNANEFVKNIGYGFASGFLMSHKIEIPSNAIEAGSLFSNDSDDINPVTGQKLSLEELEWAAREPGKDKVEMTEEEKVREAERLFVLFERLKATGVVDVKNPVQQAVEEGRFEELDD